MSRTCRTVMQVVGILLVATAAAPLARAGTGEGWLLVKKYVPDAQRSEFRGFVDSKLFVYDDAGNWLRSERASGAYETGEYVALAEGWYQVEVGHQRVSTNRWRYFVKAGRVTVVRTGLLMLPTMPAAEQTPDTCRQWRAVMDIYITDANGQLAFLASNRSVDGIDDFGMLQLHEGTYTVQFNGLRGEVDVKAERTLTVPTATLGPLPHRRYRLAMRQDESADNPSLLLCSRRPTQVLAGTWWGSYSVDTIEPPFKRLMWERHDIEPPGGIRYQAAPRVRLGKKEYRGKGSRPERVTAPGPAPPTSSAP